MAATRRRSGLPRVAIHSSLGQTKDLFYLKIHLRGLKGFPGPETDDAKKISYVEGSPPRAFGKYLSESQCYRAVPMYHLGMAPELWGPVIGASSVP